MKKILLLLIISLSIITFGCGKKVELNFNKSNPSEIILSFEGAIKSITLKNDTETFKITNYEEFVKDSTIAFDSTFFTSYENGIYTLTIEANKTVSYTLTITGEFVDFNYIRKQEIFDYPDETLYVAFTRDGCSGCEKVKPDLIAFNMFMSQYSGKAGKFVFVDYKATDYEASKGEDKNLVGIDSYEKLINDAHLSTPTIAIVENGIITSYYTGAPDISTFLNIEMGKIKSENIIYNIDSSKEIKISLNFTPKKYKFILPNGTELSYPIKDTYTPGNAGFNEGQMIFPDKFFSSYLPGSYKIKFFNDQEEKIINIDIISELNYIDIKQIFDQGHDEYYVFFLRDGCSGCNAVKPMLKTYTKNYLNYDSEENYPLYAVHRSQVKANIFGNPENFIGVTKYEDIKLGFFPRVVLIKNGVIVDVYTNSDGTIKSHFNSIMK